MVLSTLVHGVLLCLMLLAVCTTAQLIPVQPNPECDSNVPNTLNQALQRVTSDSVISLTGGVHCLHNFTVVRAVSNISLVGPDQETTSAIITCSDKTGLAFLEISSLRFVNLQIQACGLSSDSLRQVVNLTQELVQLHFIVPSETQVAVYLASVSDLYMDHVTITNTTGLGLVGINIIGDSEIQHCQFSHNVQRQQECVFTDQATYATDRGERIGGGAYFLFQDFRGFNVSSCENSSAYYSLKINGSHFLRNSECSDLTTVEFNYRDSQRAQEGGYTIGGGGGIGVMFAQVCYATNVSTTSTAFEANSATYGSAAHIGFFQGVSHSYAIFEDCQFLRNGYPTSSFDLNFTTHGGAIGLYNDLVSPNQNVPLFIHERNIGLLVKDTNFTDNGAINGGAVKIVSLVTSAVADMRDVAYFYFDNCIFTGNRAAFGPAAFIQELKLSARILGVQLMARDLTVSRNVLEVLGSITSISSVDSAAVFDVQAINVTLSGSCSFDGNIGTAMQGTESLIGVDGEVKFINNTGLYGGAMKLNQFSYVVILPNSSLEFISNVARVWGGALYVNQLGNTAVSSTFDCFLYFDYNQFEYCKTCDFTANNFTVRFINNTAPSAGTIFGSALLSCPWAISLHQKYSSQNVLQILGQYFSNHFQFIPDPVGILNVQSPVASVMIENEQSEYIVAPGESTALAIRPLDTLGQSVTGLLGAYVSLEQDVPATFFPALGPSLMVYGHDSNISTPLTVFGAENITTTIIIYGLDILGSRPAQVQIRVRVVECPIGFEYSNRSGRCECSPDLLDREIECITSNLTLLVPSGVWIGPVDSSEFAVADCIRGLCEPGGANIFVKNGMVDFDQQCRKGLNRGGVLCGTCQDGYSNVFGSVRCRKCTSNSAAILLLFLLLGVLIIVFLVLFRVNLSTGYMNGVLFWSNIVSLYQSTLAPDQSRSEIAFLANWLTLNWGVETCFHPQMTALERSWWQLSFPLYLFFLMILVRSFFKSKCFRNVDSKTAFATIQAFATLIIMCYISILQFCFELLSPVSIFTDNEKDLVRWRMDPTVAYFSGAHGFLAFVACVVLVLYILPFPIIFMFPTVLYKDKYLRRYKPIYDAFWNPFKPNFRFWLGLRLIFRWVPFIMEFFTKPPTSTFVSGFFLTILLFLQMQLQPFQSQWVNAVDSLFLVNLVLLFLGSLFFNTRNEDDFRLQQISIMTRATNYTTVFIVFAYIGIVAVFLYHLFARFPKLKGGIRKCLAKCCAQKRMKSVLRVPQSVPDQPDYVQGVPELDVITSNTRARVIGQTFFREPLLDDEGSVEIETYTSTHTSPSDGTKTS